MDIRPEDELWLDIFADAITKTTETVQKDPNPIPTDPDLIWRLDLWEAQAAFDRIGADGDWAMVGALVLWRPKTDATRERRPPVPILEGSMAELLAAMDQVLACETKANVASARTLRPVDARMARIHFATPIISATRKNDRRLIVYHRPQLAAIVGGRVLVAATSAATAVRDPDPIGRRLWLDG